MKKQSLFRLFLGLLSGTVLLFSGCNKKHSKEVNPEFARYISAFTCGNIASDAFVQVELMQELPAVELNTDIKEKLFDFSPTLKGRTFWVNGSTIRFVPEPGALLPGKEYAAAFHIGKLFRVDRKFQDFDFFFQVKEHRFSADVSTFSPASVDDPAWNTVEALLRVSNPLSEEDLFRICRIENGNKEAAIHITAVGPTRFRLTIDSLRRSNKPEHYALVIDGNPIGSKDRLTYPITLPAYSPDDFNVTDARLVEEEGPHFRLTFTHPVSSSQDLSGLITVSRVEHFTYRIDKNIIKIYPDAFPQGDLLLTVHQGLRNSEGLPLDKGYAYNFQIEGEKPQIKMRVEGNILPNSRQLYLPFSAVNLWAVDLSVVKIYQNNILHFLQSSNLYDNDSESEIRRFGRLVMKKQIRLDEDKNVDLTKWNSFSIDLSEMITDEPGAFYRVELSMKRDYSLYACNGERGRIPDRASMTRFGDREISEEDEAVWDQTSAYYYEPIDWSEYNWEDRDDPCTPSYYMERDRRKKTMVMASNLGIIAKAGGNRVVTVAVTDILTTRPVAGADVTLYNYQMQVTGTGRTDGNGFADLDNQKGKPFLVTVSKDGDVGYLEVKEEASLSLSNFDVGGKEIRKGLKGYIYTERGIWRPGDSIFVSFILEEQSAKLPAGHPVSLELFTPRNQLFQRQVKTSGLNGFYTFTVTTPPTAETGVWQAYVKVGGTSFYKPLRIEAIKPNRLKVRFDTDSILEARNGVITGTLSSQWLHGAPASDMKADIELTLTRSDRPFKGYAGYTFSNPLAVFESSTSTLFKGKLNDSGNAAVTAKVPKAENAPGMLRGTLLSRVYEAGGDMSFATQTLLYSPFESYVGVKSPASREGEFLETDKPLVFNVAAVNAYGKPVSGFVKYKIYKIAWSWWWNRNKEDLRSYVQSTSANIVGDGTADLAGGKGTITFQVNYPDWGRYLLLAEDMNSGHIAGTVFYVDWPSWRGRSAKSDPDGLTMLSFSTDKSSYEAGEEATVIIPKSSAGRVLISIENGSGILHREWVTTSEDKDTQYRLKITEEMAPNFYVFATLLQPHAQTANDLPVRMYGVVNVSVTNKNSILTPVIRMPDLLRPEKEFTVSVSEKSKKAMTYTIAVVDEGLLDLTSFRTPNAWSEFYTRERLGVRTWDLFDRVIGAHTGLMGPLLAIGGDEELKATSEKVNRFKPVVKFIGPFSLTRGETKSHKITLPQYVGSVRVMVVAGENGAYGSADKTVAVKSELMTLSTLPRTVGVGEEVWLPVNVFVTEPTVKNVKVSIQTKGLLKPLEGSTQSVAFDKPGDKVLFFKLASEMMVGAEQVVIEAIGNGAKFTETIDIGIRNPNPPMVFTHSKLVAPGKKTTFTYRGTQPGDNDWAKLELSRLPDVNFSENLDYLLQYPHGCTEQITSQGFPLLYIETFTSLKEDEKARMTAKVAEVIRLISSRQLSDGGFMYWPGDRYATEWVTSYAGHFLVEAQKNGYEVPSSVLSRWMKFQKDRAKAWTRTNPYRGYYSLSMTDLQQAYRLYTLALAGGAEAGAMNRLRELPDLSLQARWRLAAAYVLAGKKDVANSMVFNASDAIEAYGFNNDTYGSPERDQAMILETYLLLNNIDKAMGLAPSLAKSLSSGYVTTQTAAFGLKAMAQLSKMMGDGNIDASWTLNGKKMDAIHTDKAMFRQDIKPQSELSIEVSNNGKGKVYAGFVVRTQPMSDSLNLPKQGSFNLSVRYLDLKGKPIEVKTLKQGTEFVAEVTVANGIEQPFTDLALVQIFPSGWEIFNERILDRSEASSDTDGAYNFRDIRDDRVLTYFNLAEGGSKTFRVRLQAAYRGRFYLPAQSCQAMYAPKEQARNKGMWVSVVE